MKIYIANDHAGFLVKEYIKKHLISKDYTVIDLGSFSEEKVDYPNFAKKCTDEVNNDKNSFGILICGSGIGMSISANRVKGIRAALCYNESLAKLSRAHNNANILCLGARFLKLENIEEILKNFLETKFEEDRHQLRLDKINELMI